MIAGSPPEIVLPLTRAEAKALLALAGKGRVLMDVDRSFLRQPTQRDAGRRALKRLRDTVATGAPA